MSQGKIPQDQQQHLGGYGHGGDIHSWCPHLWTWAIEKFGIGSVLDIGCGEGHSTKFFKDKGCEVLGAEGSPQAIRDSVVPGFVKQHDFCDGPFRPGKTFDMVWSCEFVEHVEEKYVNNILEAFRSAGKVILLTHAVPGQSGHHHVNCQPNAYWIKHIENLGFDCRVDLTKEAKTVSLKDIPGVNFFIRTGLVFTRLTEEQIALRQKSLISPEWRAKWKACLIEWVFKTSFPYLERRRKMNLEKWARKKKAESLG